MKNYVFSFLSRFALPGLAASLTLLSPALALADTITTFDVSGTAVNTSGVTLGSCAFGATCDFSGMFQVDVTTGTYESSGLAITFPGLPTFDTLDSIRSAPGVLLVGNSVFTLRLTFTTEPTPDSLVGFTGGTITGFVSTLYENIGGTITPVPEPSSLVLLAGGLGCLVFALARGFGKKSA